MLLTDNIVSTSILLYAGAYPILFKERIVKNKETYLYVYLKVQDIDTIFRKLK